MTPRTFAWLAAATLLTIDLACTAPLGGRDGSSSAPLPVGAGPTQTIDHLMPPPDSSGGVPSRFEWTPVEGADQYAIGVWSEVDMMVWRQAGLRTASVVWPKELSLEPGTYFWSVTALRDDRPIAESGRAAFVVRQ